MTLMNVSINGPKTEKAVKYWRNEKDIRKRPKQKPYNKTYDNVTKTVEAECQTDITGYNQGKAVFAEILMSMKRTVDSQGGRGCRGKLLDSLYII